jgi:hypothetical protein
MRATTPAASSTLLLVLLAAIACEPRRAPSAALPRSFDLDGGAFGAPRGAIAPATEGAPAHLRITVGGDSLARGDLARAPAIRVYPVEAWRATTRGARRAELAGALDTLQAMLASRRYRGGIIPTLPASSDSQAVRARVRFLDFHGGAGVRFLAPSPGTPAGERLDYAFQGLTADGRFWVTATAPVVARGLAAAAPQAEAVRVLETSEDDAFTPRLDALDDVLRSLRLR